MIWLIGCVGIFLILLMLINVLTDGREVTPPTYCKDCVYCKYKTSKEILMDGDVWCTRCGGAKDEHDFCEEAIRR